MVRKPAGPDRVYIAPVDIDADADIDKHSGLVIHLLNSLWCN